MVKAFHRRKTMAGFGGMAFDIFNYAFLLLLAVTIIYPFWYLLTLSFDEYGNIASKALYLWPRWFTLKNYETIVTNKYIWTGYGNTLLRTLPGTFLAVLSTSMGGYALSKKEFPNRTFWTFFVILTMFFTGGLIPTFLWIRQIGLYDNRLVLILPMLVKAYNLVLVRNFVNQIPGELEESARIDGANDFKIFWHIILPVSKPILATIALWIAVEHWNAWFDCLVYLRDPNKFVVQVILRRIVIEGNAQTLTSELTAHEFNARPEMVKAACIFVTTFPILCIYPFVQKYFVKGIYVGSLKG